MKLKIVNEAVDHGLESCSILTGEVRDGLLHAKLRWLELGSPASVEFDWQRVWEREEERGDIVGFYHTHPPGFLDMSTRDEKTMRAWAFAFGKPLLCAIKVMETSEQSETELRSWLVRPGGDIVPCLRTVMFKDGWIIAVLDEPAQLN